MNTYDFSWIDEKLKLARQNEDPSSYQAQNMSDLDIVNQYTYPHFIFQWIDTNESCMIDNGGNGNNFAGDVDNYLEQLNEYKKKFSSTIEKYKKTY